MPKANIIQKSLICLVDKLGFFVGAGSGTRTHTVSLPTDFESVTSANSIIPAKLPYYYITSVFKNQVFFEKLALFFLFSVLRRRNAVFFLECIAKIRCRRKAHLQAYLADRRIRILQELLCVLHSYLILIFHGRASGYLLEHAQKMEFAHFAYIRVIGEGMLRAVFAVHKLDNKRDLIGICSVGVALLCNAALKLAEYQKQLCNAYFFVSVAFRLQFRDDFLKNIAYF